MIVNSPNPNACIHSPVSPYILVWVPFSAATHATLESCWEAENCFLLLHRGINGNGTTGKRLHCAGLWLTSPVLIIVFENKNLCEMPAPRLSTLCQDLFLGLPSGQWWLMAQMKDLKLDCWNETNISPSRVKMFIPQLKFNFFFPQFPKKLQNRMYEPKNWERSV